MSKIFDAPFGVIPELRLQYVPRWSIINMDRTQSVAEHSFNVAMIVKYLCEKTGRTPHMDTMIIDALFHDAEEVYLGDMPTPSKDSNTKPSVTKLADLIESYRYAVTHCRDTKDVRAFVIKPIIQRISDMALELSIPCDVVVPLIEEVN